MRSMYVTVGPSQGEALIIGRSFIHTPGGNRQNLIGVPHAWCI
jgi:hypothetical protein